MTTPPETRAGAETKLTEEQVIKKYEDMIQQPAFDEMVLRIVHAEKVRGEWFCQYKCSFQKDGKEHSLCTTSMMTSADLGTVLDDFIRLADEQAGQLNSPTPMNQNNTEEWNKELCRLASLVGTDAKNPEEKLINFVHQELQKARAEAQQEYKQFVLNVLDGVDIADGQCNTKAIRFALQSRTIQSELRETLPPKEKEDENTGRDRQNGLRSHC